LWTKVEELGGELVKIEKLMVRNVVTVPSDVQVHKAFKLMNEK